MSVFLAVLVFYPFLGALGAFITGGKNEKIRDYFSDFIVVSEFLLMLALFFLYAGRAGEEAVLSCTVPAVCGFGLHFILDGFRLFYALIAALMWMMTTILSREYFTHHGNRTRFYVFLLMTLGATMGVFLSSDLYTTFIFFEIMSFTSYVWVAQEENNAALRAASTYLAVAVMGGLVMLMGVFMVYHTLGTLEIGELLAAAKSCDQKGILYAAGCCMLFGFGAKAGAFPLHIWLPKAHPVAPAPASALLSGILTKTGIYGTLIVSCQLFLHDMVWGRFILAIGVLTMFGGAMLAVFSIDLKRTLACSSMSQIGFIMVGIGMQCMLGEENALAVHGTLLHMANHSMIKLVLFMAAGVIYMNTHSLDLNKIRGYGRKKPLLKVIFLIGALAIGGIPCFSGYISKTLLHESIVEFGGGMIMKAVEYIFLFSGGLTVAYMTKLFIAIFVEKNEDAALQSQYDNETKYMNAESTFALAGSAAILFFWGILPQLTMNKAAALGQAFMNLEEYGEEVAYFSLKNLSGGLVSITIGALVYLFFIRLVLMKDKKEYLNRWPSWFDLENILYRPLLLEILPAICGFFCDILDNLISVLTTVGINVGTFLARIPDTLVDAVIVGLRKTVYKDSPLPQERAEGTVVTQSEGLLLNALQTLGNRTVNRKNPGSKDYVHAMAMRRERRRESYTIIQRSLSFAMLLVCIGLFLTLIYVTF